MEFNRHDIKVLRMILKLNQRQFGFMLDRSQALVTAWESGRKPIGSKAQADIKKRFDVTPEVHMAIREISNLMQEVDGN